jgi:hypothetical protein
MSVEQVGAPAPVGRTIAAPRRRRPAWPPRWLVVALGAAYVLALAALVFLPGDSLIARLRALDGGICAQAGTHSYWPGGE